MTKKLIAAPLLAACVLLAAEPALSNLGKLLFKDDFSANSVWNGKVGIWEVVDGAAKVSEDPKDKHGAVRRHPVRYRDGRIEFSFKLDGASKIALMLNEPGAHVCLLYITPTGISLDQGKTAKGDIGHAVLAKRDMAIETGKWHRAVLEVRGNQLLAQINGGPVLSGQSDRLDVPKNDIGFLVDGVSALFDDVQLFELQAH